MNNKFTVINSTNEDKSKEKDRTSRNIKLCNLWERQYCNSVLQVAQKNKDIKVITDYPQEDIKKMAFSGIKYINSFRELKRERERMDTDYAQTLEESKAIFQLIDSVFVICSCLTIRNFINAFPIDKDYSGEKWGVKDYFSTMDVLSKMDWDKPIGRNELSELLWDYENADLRNVYLEFTTAMSAIYRSQTGKGIAEQWCEDHGIDTYSVDRKTGIMKNNQTGDIFKAKKVSNLHVVK